MDTRLVAKEKQLESWASLIHKCKNSGTKTKYWLAQNSISREQYYYWLRLVREKAYFEGKNEAAKLNQVVRIECENVDNPQNISSDMITINHGRLNISIPVTTDVNAIRAIMEVAVRAE